MKANEAASTKNDEKDISPPLVFVPALFGTELFRRGSPDDPDAHEKKVFVTVRTALGLETPDISLPLQQKRHHADLQSDDKSWNTTANTEHRDDISSSEDHKIFPRGLMKGLRLSLCCFSYDAADHYGTFSRYFEANHPNFYVFDYDWRLDLNDTTDKLITFLSDIKIQHNGQAPQVISHSMGCLVTLAALHSDSSLFHSSIFVAGNFAGGSGYFPVIRRATYTGLNRKYLDRPVYHTFPSIYATASPRDDPILKDEDGNQMFEFVDMARLRDTGEKVVVPIDLYDIEHWKKYKLGPWSLKEEVSAEMEEHVATCLQLGIRFQKRARNTCECKNDSSQGESKTYPSIAVLVGDQHLDPDHFLWNVEESHWVPWTPKLLKQFKPANMERTDSSVAYVSTTQPQGLPDGVEVKIYTGQKHGDDHRRLMLEVDLIEGILEDLRNDSTTNLLHEGYKVPKRSNLKSREYQKL